MQATPSTPAARLKAKRILKSVKDRAIQIWDFDGSYEVVTFERPGFSYGSIRFESKIEAFRHILKRAANTGFDLARFGAIADRYARRFGIPA